MGVYSLRGLSVKTSLTGAEARELRAARDTPGGAYSGLSAPTEHGDLASAGLAEYREEPCEAHGHHWTDYYLVPTERGLALLAAFDRIA